MEKLNPKRIEDVNALIALRETLVVAIPHGVDRWQERRKRALRAVLREVLRYQA
jgi:hypothetical protein